MTDERGAGAQPAQTPDAAAERGRAFPNGVRLEGDAKLLAVS